MDKEKEFAALLADVTKLGREQKGIVSEDQVKEAFEALSLSDDQLTLVYDYLKKHGIGIGTPADPEEFLSEEEHNYLKDYEESLKELPEVSENEKIGITISAMSGDKSAQNRLIEIYLPSVPDIAKMYVDQGVYIEDLIGEGNLVLTSGVTMLGAIEKPEEAEAFLTKMIMDAMEELISDSLDEDARGQKAVKHVQKVADKAAELAKELRRSVTVEELAEESGMSVDEIIEAIRMTGNNIEDIDYTEE
ncbi:RNA polymerase primary sigma factor [Butyrivibrio fibrisolvens DSM 3071]|uniref:RNA polymerase primary sigma factor n=1 Tax=Butyrivibrio fibrisolvens DSM 3071 TaxID=1121131 RepID=A0A1M5YTD1_BUTFI|nr:sigma-70 domain-containing protein [Butyrivibrio fibrisolvens]SHI15088.1 RNA polymerase primary sigma factor [Butyrivibrio fibrisolvens DSM 3071]